MGMGEVSMGGVMVMGTGTGMGMGMGMGMNIGTGGDYRAYPLGSTWQNNTWAKPDSTLPGWAKQGPEEVGATSNNATNATAGEAAPGSQGEAVQMGLFNRVLAEEVETPNPNPNPNPKPNPNPLTLL